MKTLLNDEQIAHRIEEPDFQVPLFIEEDKDEYELFDDSLDDM